LATTFTEFSDFAASLDQFVRQTRKEARTQARRESLLAAGVFAGVVLLAELFLNLLDVPRWLVPKPSEVAVAFIDAFWEIILPNALVTLTEVAVGFTFGVVVGVSLGGLIANFRILDKVLSPFILILITTPIVALVPLLMLWLGYGMTTKIVAVAIASFPPIMMNTITGLDKTPAMQIDLVAYLGANRWKQFWKIRFPNALSSIFTGLIIGSIFGLITAVSAEFVGGSTGLGNRLIYYASTLNTPLLFAIIGTLAAVGVSLYLSISWTRTRVIRWHE
jgi:NitT/TauT family transport system permease protein